MNNLINRSTNASTFKGPWINASTRFVAENKTYKCNLLVFPRFSYQRTPPNAREIHSYDSNHYTTSGSRFPAFDLFFMFYMCLMFSFVYISITRLDYNQSFPEQSSFHYT